MTPRFGVPKCSAWVMRGKRRNWRSSWLLLQGCTDGPGMVGCRGTGMAPQPISVLMGQGSIGLGTSRDLQPSLGRRNLVEIRQQLTDGGGVLVPEQAARPQLVMNREMCRGGPSTNRQDLWSFALILSSGAPLRCARWSAAACMPFRRVAPSF